MALTVLCLPVVRGKEAKWQEMASQFGERPTRDKLSASRNNAGVHERTFLQTNPDGGLGVIVTLEGDNPLEAFGRMMADPSMTDFAAWAVDVHGLEPDAGPPPVPQLIFDSKA